MISVNIGGLQHQKPIKDKGDIRKELQKNCCLLIENNQPPLAYLTKSTFYNFIDLVFQNEEAYINTTNYSNSFNWTNF